MATKPAQADKRAASATTEEQFAVQMDLPDNENIRNLPLHLKQYIINQNYEQYTPINHAVWRYVMRQNYDFLREHAHLVYFEGLEKTGIGVEKIPSIHEMNEILQRIGWAAVSVDGFIPPAAFMEYQAHKVLVIAADIRQLKHIEYTPAPDILHEAAGHAPIIADIEYADYLCRFGEVGARAMSSKKDWELYQAIRHLSILKEAPDSDPAEVKQAEADVEYKQKNLGEPSEMALLSRLHWWTVEYGLIGTLDKPKIYGAGLLSSIGESANCLKPHVKKIPYTIDAMNYPFDITTQQPQLFVTPDFVHLNNVLDEFSAMMAWKRGGKESVHKAIDCEAVSTCEYASGLQVSGVFSDMIVDDRGELAYIKTEGATNLAYDFKELPGHGVDYHKDGFSSPVGKLRHSPTPLERCDNGELEHHGVVIGKHAELVFESGVKVSGDVEGILCREGKVQLITFGNCTVTYHDEVLFKPDWGKYDMAVGTKIVSVFAGAADKDAYQQPSLVPRERTIKIKYSDREMKLNDLYQRVRDIRERKQGFDQLPAIWEKLQQEYSGQWLLPLEILEILRTEGMNEAVAGEIESFLQKRVEVDESLKKMIDDGLRLLGKMAPA